jgi:hypothetical protein
VETDPGSVARVKVARLASRYSREASLGEPDPDKLAAPGPDHWHTVTGLLVPPLGTPEDAPERPEPRPLRIGSDGTRTALLFDSGDGWRLRGPFGHRIASWSDRPGALVSGQLYEVGHIPPNGERCGVVVWGEPVEAVDVAGQPAAPAVLVS